ncbi:E3 ubiquitin/ISG15 ligase TRIM25-like [Anomaloglossus baeobatrachus]|uniref:E3 ubiquitin/ISG15 ligase TRIM25-like n=1 Tax=Anomaloglossus baeobatrachus TaxID=238106 RepID=UPI003F50A6A9
MASTGLKKEPQCSICLTLYTDSVTLRCGHNFCRDCIDRVLDTEGGSGVYTCPECREEFHERPTLTRNITLRNEVKFWSTQSHQKITGICCTYCIDSPVPAVRSCLLCEASLCDNHLRVHSKGPEHVLTDPSTSLENWKCSVHKKILQYYCTEDFACVCVSCYLIGEHQGHKMEPLNEASEKKKVKLRNILQNLVIKREEAKKRFQSLEERRKKAKNKSCRKAERVTALFIDIRRRLDDLEKKILSEISRREEQVSLSDLIQKLEIKKDELSRKMRNIKELCNMTDPLTVLQEPDTSDLSDPEEDGGDEDTGGQDGGGEDTGGHDGGDEDTEGHDGGDEDTGGHDEGDEDTGGHDGGDWDAELISHITHTLSAMIRDINVTFYVRDPADILLDVNTAANNLLISNDLKTATWIWNAKNYLETAERFQDYAQVMSRRGFTSGRHYWDVEISRSRWWKVGMCYPSIDRRGLQSYIGDNNKSWGLVGGLGYNNQCSVKHDSELILLPHPICSNRFRICLNYEAGQLSLYELCDPIRHLHTFTATFSEPLHAVLYVYDGCIKISEETSVRNLHHRRHLPRDW